MELIHSPIKMELGNLFCELLFCAHGIDMQRAQGKSRAALGASDERRDDFSRQPSLL
jgi:hypothetical protein